MVRPPPPPVHAYLRAWREHRDLTLEQVAEAFNKSHTTISRWEAGKVTIKEADLAKLAALYNATAGQLRAPVDEAKLVSRLDQLQEVVWEMDDADFADFMIVARRFRKQRPD